MRYNGFSTHRSMYVLFFLPIFKTIFLCVIYKHVFLLTTLTHVVSYYYM